MDSNKSFGPILKCFLLEVDKKEERDSRIEIWAIQLPRKVSVL